MLWGKNKDGKVKVWELPRIKKTDDSRKDAVRKDARGTIKRFVRDGYYVHDWYIAPEWEKHERVESAEKLNELVAQGEAAVIARIDTASFDFDAYWAFNKLGMKVYVVGPRDLSALKKMYAESREVQNA